MKEIAQYGGCERQFVTMAHEIRCLVTIFPVLAAIIMGFCHYGA